MDTPICNYVISLLCNKTSYWHSMSIRCIVTCFQCLKAQSFLQLYLIRLTVNTGQHATHSAWFRSHNRRCEPSVSQIHSLDELWNFFWVKHGQVHYFWPVQLNLFIHVIPLIFRTLCVLYVWKDWQTNILKYLWMLLCKCHAWVSISRKKK